MHCSLDMKKQTLKKQRFSDKEGIPPDQAVFLQLVDENFGGFVGAGNIPADSDVLSDIGVTGLRTRTFFFMWGLHFSIESNREHKKNNDENYKIINL